MGKTQEIGKKMEDLACDYLQQQGLKLVKRNYRCKLGEIDLIMQDNSSIVFVEVRYRESEKFGGSLQSVTVSKQKKLCRAAEVYLQQNNLYEKVPARFDVIAISKQPPSLINWIKDAI